MGHPGDMPARYDLLPAAAGEGLLTRMARLYAPLEAAAVDLICASPQVVPPKRGLSDLHFAVCTGAESGRQRAFCWSGDLTRTGSLYRLTDSSFGILVAFQ